MLPSVSAEGRYGTDLELQRRQVLPGMELTPEFRRAVAIEEATASRSSGPPVRVLIYRPRAAGGDLPLVLRIHGGGFTGLAADSFPAVDAGIAGLGATVVSVDYRLAPEHPFPAAPEDCYAALCWAYDTLAVDRTRVVVTGSSAGGALAAAVALMARDRRGPRITHQLLQVPVLDDRLITSSMRQQPVGRDGMTAETAAEMWRSYLPHGTDRSCTPPYAAPARARRLSALPATFVQVHARDALRDEGLMFAQRLRRAGVPVEVHCATGLDHAGNPKDSLMAQEAQRVFDAAVRRALTVIPKG
jgi:acetyl esterase